MKQKIVHYIATLRDGGAQTQLILLCNGLDLTSYDVYIICWNKESTLIVRDEINIIEINRGTKFNTIGFMLRVFSQTMKIRPNIIHLWLPEIITFPAALAGFIQRASIVSTERRIPVSKIGKLWFRDRVKYLNHILSQTLIANFPLPIKKKSLLNLIANCKGQTIYNGLDISSLRQLRVVDKKQTTTFQIVYAGRFVSQKNVDIIIKAIKELSDENYNVSLMLFGTGELKEILQNLVSNLQLNDIITFYGYTDDWKSIASGADVFVLPSDREGMPNVLFEAAAIGLPIISSRIEEISCHFTDNYDALLIEENEVSFLKEAIIKLVNNPDLKEVLKENVFKTVEKYSVEKMVMNYQKLYYKLLNQG